MEPQRGILRPDREWRSAERRNEPPRLIRGRFLPFAETKETKIVVMPHTLSDGAGCIEGMEGYQNAAYERP
ncbi:MAG: hypothetical protein ACRDI2_21680, partial [Chloroflexota bacterium]